MVLMEKGQPLAFDKAAASGYLKSKGDVHSTVCALDFSWRQLLPAAFSLPASLASQHRTPLPSLPPLPPRWQVNINISVGKGPGAGMAWGCDLSYDYVKINAEYTT